MSLSPKNWKQIEELYLAVVDAQPSRRAKLLAESDPEIGKIVRRMLKQESTAILDQPAWQVETQSMENASGPGSVLGPYRLDCVVGAGGPPLLTLPHLMSYPFLQSLFDGLLPHGLYHYWKADFVRDLTDAAIAEHARFGPSIPNIHSVVHIYPTCLRCGNRTGGILSK
jgi:hypothetical protein